MRKTLEEALMDLLDEYADVDLDERISALELALYAMHDQERQ